jgi:hypothetical protein
LTRIGRESNVKKAQYGTLLAELSIGARLLARLPFFLRHPVRLPEAKDAVRRRLERREADFLAIARVSIFGNPSSPYRRLLRMARCEYGDLERSVTQDGLEHTLGLLFRNGVYLSVDEFKGRRDAVRAAERIEAGPSLLRNPLSAFHVSARSSGSRGAPTPVLIDLAFVRDCAMNTLLLLDARGGARRVAIWEAPGAGTTFRLLKYAVCGAAPERWFSQVSLSDRRLHQRYRWSARLMRWESALAGPRLPGPEYAPLHDPLPVARWIAETARGERTPHLFTLGSPAVMLCHRAVDAGIDLSGAEIILAGEPVTDVRLAAVRRSGATPIPRYGSIETGPIGYACMRPEASDDVHLLSDLHAVIQGGPEGEAAGIPANGLLVTSLRATAPFVLLNVSMGDQALMTRRRCGCPLERVGWSTHLRSIRSYEKLTAGGVTFLDTDLIRVLEEVLPARFGGLPTHYQLLEEESDQGRPRIRLLVHPAVGDADSAQIAEAFLESIGWGTGGERIMGLELRDGDVLRVERRAPVVTGSGKVHHLVRGQRE